MVKLADVKKKKISACLTEVIVFPRRQTGFWDALVLSIELRRERAVIG